MEKIPFVINDLVLIEEFCNLKCDYCEGFYPTEYTFRGGNNKLVMPDSWKMKIKQLGLEEKISESPTVQEFFNLGLDIIADTRKHFTTPILKISGGEIFLNNNLMNFISVIHDKYEGIQLLTNASLFSEREIDALAEFGNVYFQVSIDNHLFSKNITRTKNQNVHQKMINNLAYIQKKGMGLEVNCVITKHNIDAFGEFLDYLNNGTTIVFPRPVRREPRETLGASIEQVKHMHSVLENYDKYKDALPSPIYLERIISTIGSGFRKWDCYVPFFVLGTNNYGQLNTCACSGELPVIDSIFNLKKINKDTLSQNMQYNPKSRVIPCSDCINQYDVFDLYVDGLMSESELLKIPTFQYKGVLDETRKIKDKIITNNT